MSTSKTLERINRILDETRDSKEKGVKSKMDKDDYEELFKKKLKEWGIKSPKQLTDKKKREFFQEIEKEWNKKIRG